MNLLAHALLSGKDPGAVVGGTLADWIKGPVDETIPSALAEGLRRHRRVDLFTDAHPITGVSRRRLHARWGRYSGILVDMAYDFCLAANWDRYGPGTLEEFVEGVHGMIRDFGPSLPPIAARVADRLIAEEWMFAGKSWERIRIALGRISRRLRRPVDLGAAAADLEGLECEMTQDFHHLFPQILRYSDSSPGERRFSEA